MSINEPSTQKGLKRITRQCIFCHKEFTLWVNKDGYDQWQRGKLIQHALPELSENDRELLISGICGLCFDKTFGEPHE